METYPEGGFKLWLPYLTAYASHLIFLSKPQFSQLSNENSNNCDFTRLWGINELIYATCFVQILTYINTRWMLLVLLLLLVILLQTGPLTRFSVKTCFCPWASLFPQFDCLLKAARRVGRCSFYITEFLVCKYVYS